MAILTLDENVDYSTTISPICLATDDSSRDKGNFYATVAGWGTVRDGGQTSDYLRKVDVRVWTNKKCKDSYGTKAPGGIIDSMICASTPELHKDSCAVSLI